MAKDFHNKKFDKGTKQKLVFFQEYFKEAFPVFLHGYFKGFFLCDFFAGTGKNKFGEKGTPLLILDNLVSECKTIRSIGKKIIIVFNDLQTSQTLQNNVNDFFVQCKKKHSCNECYLEKECVKEVKNEDAKIYFGSVLSELSKSKYEKYGILLFIDPFNTSFSKDMFLELMKFKRLDFISFMPSNYVKRFPEFIEKFNLPPNINTNVEQNLIHKSVAEAYENLIPAGQEYYLAHFSIQKGKNKYGVIFGSNHTLGMEKFLKICYQEDPEIGEANYNIDKRLVYEGQLSLFDTEIPEKFQNFNTELEKKILDKELKNNKEVYKFALKKKCLPKHANLVLKKLIGDGRIEKIKLISSDIHKIKEAQTITII